MTSFIPVDYNPFDDSFILTTEEQREIFTSIQIGGDAASLAYNESVGLKLKGKCDVETLQKSCIELVNRHDALRSTFSEDGTQLNFSEHVKIEIPFLDFTDLSEEDKLHRVKHFTTREVEIPFDLKSGPVIRFAIIKLKQEEHLLIITAHHIVCDGWSIGIMMQDISKFYSAFVTHNSPKLEDVISFREYALRQTERITNGEFEKTEKWWLDVFANDIPVVDLPVDKLRPSSRTFNAARIDVMVDAQLVKAIKQFGAKQGCSYVNTLFAAFEIFLYRITKQTELVLGLPAAGQSAAAMYQVVGHCVNLLPVRSSVNENIIFAEYIKERKKKMFDAFDHQEFTMGTLLNKLPIQRDPGRIPLVPAVFNVDLGITSGVNFEGLQYEFISNPRKYENFEFFVNATGTGDALNIECTYNTDLFDAVLVEQRMKEFVVMLNGIIEYPELPVKSLPILTPEEKIKLFVDWVKLSETKLQNETLISLFEEQVRLQPNAVAIWFNGEQITFQQLNNRVNKLANYLRKRNVKTETLVGICSERNLNLIVALLAVKKAGGAYVPLDPNYPADRIAFILDDAKAPVLITTETQLGNLPKTDAEIICIDKDWLVIESENAENPESLTKPQNLAYIIYTSGSTGKPKGVAIEHRNAVAMIEWARTVYSREEISGVLASTSVCFDLSIFEIFFTLCSGGRIVLVKDALALPSLPLDANVTLVNTVPSAIAELLKLDNGIPKSVQTINLAGEPLSVDLVSKIYQNTTAKEVFDLYGPSEDTTYSTYVLRQQDGPYTIGKAITNSQVYLLDKNLKPVPIGIAGEIYIGGAGLARGYLYRDEMTAERFIQNPFNPETRLYKTGDLGKFYSDGNIEFLGRIDNQVKIRGFRIELGEIETVLRKHSAIKDLVVTVREDIPGDKRLVAYVSPKQNQTININELKTHLKKDVPDYMVPSAFVVMDALPLTPNGKIDRKALPKPDVQVKVESANFEEPHTPVESMLTGIWCEILNHDKIGIHDNFFELGGHSLLGIRMMGEIQKKLGIKLEYPVLFRASTIHQLSKIINNEDLNIEWPILVPLQLNGNKTPLFCIHMHNGNIQRWRVLLKYLGNDQPVYAIQPRGLDEKQPFHTNIEEMATFYIQQIKKVQPVGPYNFFGLCFGGMVVFEMAKQLERVGEKVHFAGMVNNYAPPENPMQYKMQEMLNTFIEMDLSKKVDFALEKTKNVGKKVLAKVLGKKFDKSSGGISEEEISARPDIRFVHTTALLNYQPKESYNGNVTLIRTGEETAKHYDEHLGWGRLIKGNLKIEFVAESDNDSVITEEKYYSQLAAIVKKELE